MLIRLAVPGLSAAPAAVVEPGRLGDVDVIAAELAQSVCRLVANGGRLVLHQHVASPVVEEALGPVIDGGSAREHAGPVLWHRVLDRANLDAFDLDQSLDRIVTRRQD